MRELEFNTMLAELTPAQRAAAGKFRLKRFGLAATTAGGARGLGTRVAHRAGFDGGRPEAPELDLGANGADGKAPVLKLKGEGDARLFTLGPELFARPRACSRRRRRSKPATT